MVHYQDGSYVIPKYAGGVTHEKELFIAYSGKHGCVSNETEFIKELDQLADEGKQILFLTEQFPNMHRLYGRVDNTTWIDAAGDLSALVTPELEEVVTQWMNERNKWQAPKTTADVFMESMNELTELVRMEVAMLNCARHAFS